MIKIKKRQKNHDTEYSFKYKGDVYRFVMMGLCRFRDEKERIERMAEMTVGEKCIIL